jgi:hypothetical protein
MNCFFPNILELGIVIALCAVASWCTVFSRGETLSVELEALGVLTIALFFDLGDW